MKSIFLKSTAILLLITFSSCQNSTNNKENTEVLNLEKSTSDSLTEKAKERLEKVPQGMRNSDLFSTEILKPTQLFDNVYYIGYVGVGVFLINTTDGLILIDSMWNQNDAETVIVPGIKELGFDPAQVKKILITHEHSDHYGGARFFEKNYGSEVLMSKTAWEGLHSNDAEVLTDPFGNLSSELEVPKQYTEVKNGENISLGDKSITVYLTPGHAPGGLSLLFSVEEQGEKHTVALWGGTGLPKTLEANQNYLNSLNMFQDAANKAQADVNLSNHPFTIGLVQDMETLRSNATGDTNPLIKGNENLNQYFNTNLKPKVLEKIQELKSEKEKNN
ncbi:MBL fold metallo-hydrolase [Leeuwenhoekiella sp. MAR_2009_132]|uniref:MBL fold metallo-hydrolase n=1 Tax=Leeuwenhoekiella sp. MAR_2009_132 TaxID=1392489 RepID=UPI00068FA725|nr:MBL fold metallo-hydrolase [Leeuwenhoekiella sp. MAR_2009_132]